MNTRDDWLAERRKGVGGSDAAAALGQSPYMTALELYYDKVGDAVPRDLDADGIERTTIGREIENVVATLYAEHYGVRLRRRNQILRHQKYDFVIANVDRTIDGRKAGLEIKNVDHFSYRNSGLWGEPESDEVPPHYLLQCHHYLLTLDYDVWYLAALVGGNRMVRYVIERDHEMDELLIDGEMKFWTHVLEEKPPDLDYQHPHAVDFLKRLYRGTDGTTIDLDESLLHWHSVRLDAHEKVDRYQGITDGARAHILDTMKDAVLGRLPNGGAYKRSIVHNPEHMVQDSEYVKLTYIKPKAKARERVE